MQPNYDAMTDTEERKIIINLIDNGTFDLARNPEVHGILREEFNNDVLERFSAKHGTDDYDRLLEPEFCELLNAITDEMSTDVLLGIGDIYSVVKEALNNDVLDQWVAENPTKAYPLTFVEVQDNPMSLSISDDDLCADCQFLAYSPGDLSLCRLAVLTDDGWPCTEANYVEDCEHFTPNRKGDDNLISTRPPAPKEEDTPF
jgi:hypothetical protein